MGAMWRSNYDMPPDQFSAEIERLWQQVKPLYDSLHAYTRSQLVKQYGPSAVTSDGLIRADLLGNPWAQEWGNIYPLVAPKNSKGMGFDLTEILQQKKTEPIAMVHYGENFFKSLGFAPLPETFWERSLFLKPKDREVVCHASAWDIDNKDDLRLKMCIIMHRCFTITTCLIILFRYINIKKYRKYSDFIHLWLQLFELLVLSINNDSSRYFISKIMKELILV
jgi:peptidyl-dipeptidase A